MKISLVVTFLGWLLATIQAAPTASSLRDRSLAERNIPVWQFYYDVTSAQHQTNFNKWSAAGYRIISLSAYGQPPNHRYAAVWVQRSGPSYWAIHEASSSTYQSWFDTHSKAGYVSTIITVTGLASAPIFAGVMEQNGVTNWYQKCGMSNNQYVTELNNAQSNRYILKSFTEYGSSSNRLYCGIWYSNDQWDNIRLRWTSPITITKLLLMPRPRSHFGAPRTSPFPKIIKFRLNLWTPMLDPGSQDMVWQQMTSNPNTKLKSQPADTSSTFKEEAQATMQTSPLSGPSRISRLREAGAQLEPSPDFKTMLLQGHKLTQSWRIG